MSSIRMDRLASVCFFEPLRRVSHDFRCEVPILMYHSIADEDESHLKPYYRTATHPDTFAEQMRLLHDAGYSTLRVAEAVEGIRRNSPEMSKAVVITFDDGFRNFYSKAFPVLNQFGFTATVYLPTDHIGKTAKQFMGRDCLTWGEIQALQEQGISFGSHTMSHPKLYGLPWDVIEREVSLSKQIIEQELGASVTSFAYPYAFPQVDRLFKESFRRLLCGSGYTNGVCTTIGMCRASTDPFFLSRLPVNSCDDASFFRAKLLGGYDWLATPQYLAKIAKQWMR
jgi:peptidoglycan/xylan/chitin deacetylase (PgdA/CDA1 family)